MYLLWNYPQVIVSEPHWWYVNIGSGYGLVPSGNKPLPELMFTQFNLAIWGHSELTDTWVNISMANVQDCGITTANTLEIPQSWD